MHSFRTQHCTRETIRAADANMLFHTTKRSLLACMDVCLLKCSARYLMVSIALLRKTCRVNRRQITKISKLAKQIHISLNKAFQLYTPTFMHLIQCNTHKKDKFSIKHIKLHIPNQIRNVKKQILILIILFDVTSLLEQVLIVNTPLCYFVFITRL